MGGVASGWSCLWAGAASGCGLFVGRAVVVLATPLFRYPRPTERVKNL